MASIKSNNLAQAIISELVAYSEETTEEIKEKIKEISEECCEEIRKNSPEKSGKYKQGWKVKVAFESRNDIRCTIYNANKPQLTHLLEKGHAKVKGGRVEGKEHIGPAEEMAGNEVEKSIKEIYGWN